MSPADQCRAGYRPGVGLMMFNAAGLVFTGRRIDTPGDAWQMPQGGIDPGEAPREAALRELGEEVGTDRAVIVAETADWLRYEFPADLQPRVWGGRYRGQAQKWFLLRFFGTDEDIDIHGPHPEFDAWRWSPLDALAREIVAFKRDLYQRLAAEFAARIRRELEGG